MPKRSLLAVVLLAACQPGEPTARVVRAHAITPMALIAQPPANVRDESPPFSLTASDGSGLALTRVDAKAVVQGPLAFTELHLYFKNPEARTREGTFTITLPPGAAVSRFGMEIDGRMQEAEVVEKQAARRIYDDFLHRKQDPALLEKGAGNQFSAKVFPIPANAEKHLVVSFSQELPGRGYVLPLRGLPTIARVDAQLTLTDASGKAELQTLGKRDWQPDSDFTAAVGTPAAGVSAGELVVASLAVTPRGDAVASTPTAMTLLVDTSASRALGFTRYVASIRELVGAIAATHGAVALQVVAFDQDTQVIFDGAASAYGVAQDRVLLERGAAGASNLAQAVAALSPRQRVVIVTDGVMTAGADAPAAIKQLRAERVDVVLAGGIRDERAAATMVRQLPQAGDVFDLERDAGAIAAGLGETVLTDVTIDVPGATWVYPRTLPAARPGSTLMVYARMPRPTQQVTINAGDMSRTIALGSAAPALIQRAIAGAEIEELENMLATVSGDQAAELREDIALRSVQSRVISSQTSMIVLETEYDYERYDIPRTALADILVVGPRGLEQQKRSDALLAATPPPAIPTPPAEPQMARAQAIEEARAAGTLGTVARAGGGLTSLTATGDISSGFDDSNVYGGLFGTEDGESEGGFGFGRSGFGPGGGGTGESVIGTGRYGTIGHGTGIGSGYGVGAGRGGMRGRAAAAPLLRLGQAQAVGQLDRAIIRRYIKRNIQKLAYCYEKQLLARPGLKGTVTATFDIQGDGTVKGATASGVDADVAACVAGVIRLIEFPRPRKGSVKVTYPLVFAMDAPAPAPAPRGRHWDTRESPLFAPPGATDDGDHSIPALTGKLADVMSALRAGNTQRAHELATAWHAETPGDLLALVGLGETLEKLGDEVQAARVYGSIIDLYPNRADMRRFAGERLERLGHARELIIDTYRRAVADRPDHATGHRLLAYALVRSGDLAGAFAAILAGVDQTYPLGRFEGADRILREDAEMIAAAYLANGGPKESITAELVKRELTAAKQPSTRFIMYWETDSNDVDFHIKDARGGHAWYSYKGLRSGGELYADVTTGYGPECFAIPGTPSAGPYKLSINYYSQGPMGFGMGLLQVQRFTGKDFTFEDRPYVVMNDGAFVELGSYR